MARVLICLFLLVPTRAASAEWVPAPQDASRLFARVDRASQEPRRGDQPSDMILERASGLRVENVLLRDALLQLSEESGVTLAFSPSFVPNDRRVSCDCENLSVDGALHRLLDGTGLRHQMVGRHILIEPRPVPSVPAPPPISIVAPLLDNPFSVLTRERVSITLPPPPVVGTITGRVVARESGAPLSAVQVYIPDLDLGVLTQANGRYLLANVPAGTHRLMAERIGYRAETVMADVQDQATVTYDFQLGEEALALDALIVTGTAGGSQRRAVGNAVNQLEVSSLAGQRAVTDVASALSGRVPGLQLQRSTGTVGDGSRIQIRGVGSFALSSNPLIYIDGVRVNNDSRAGPPIGQANASSFKADDLGGGSTNLLNDLNPEEIESIEIIKGPAAATLYGTEASAGVIQIITKRGREGAPQFDLSVTQGMNFLMDPAGKMGTNFLCTTSPLPPCAEADRIPYNMYEESNRYISGEVLDYDGQRVFDWPTKELFQNGHVQTYDLSVRGGTSSVRYFVSANYADEEGIEWYNYDEKYRGRANLNVLLSEDLTLDVNASYLDGFTRYGDPVAGEGGSFREAKDALWPCLIAYQGVVPGTRVCEQAGYYERHPGFIQQVETTRDASRFIGGVTLNHTWGEWLSHRAIFGIDKGWDKNQRYFPRTVPASYNESAEGTIDLHTPVSTNLSLEYSATVSLDVASAWGLETSVGAQYFARQYESIRMIGRDFASDLSTTINQTPVEKMTVDHDFIENKSVGMFAQEQIDWNDRVFVTAAIRLDDNSAFGGNFDAQIYPKVSAAWVVSEESFWNLDFVNSLRLRAAWGKAGRQPNTLAARNVFGVIPGIDGGTAIAPQQPGNPNVGPEVSSEIEGGFEVAVLEDRISGEFTYYRRKNEGALLARSLAPSVGMPGSVQQNLGRIDNWGWEAALRSEPYRSEMLSVQLDLTASHTDNEIKQLGDLAPSNTIRVGYPYPNYTTPYLIRAAEQDASGNLVQGTVMCDAGVATGGSDAPVALRGLVPGGPVEPCATSGRKDIMFGRAFHPYTFTVSPTLSLFENAVQVFALAEGKHGGWNVEENAPYQAQYGGGRKYWDHNDPVYLAGRFPNGPFRDNTVDRHYRADFWKLREVGLRYQLPDALAGRVGADRASLTFSGRGLWTIWRRSETVGGVAIPDPDNGSAQLDNSGNYYVTPPTSSLHLSLRLSF